MLDGNKYILKRHEMTDYQKKKAFSSFLPSVSGINGKPIWAFYANRGQCLASFGTGSKDTPMYPFQSVPLIYSSLKTGGFKTFLKIDSKVYTPFVGENETKRTLSMTNADFSIREDGELYSIEVLYSSVPEENFPALIRKVTIKNNSDHDYDLSFLDGTTVFLPYGISTWTYWNQPFLGCAYAEIVNELPSSTFVKLKTSMGDHSMVSKATIGHGFFVFDENDRGLVTISDPYCIFGDDESCMTSKPFEELSEFDFISQKQRNQNYFPCAFAYTSFKLKSGESHTFYEYYGKWADYDEFEKTAKRLNKKTTEQYISRSEELIEELIAPATSHTAYKGFDDFYSQSYLDNYLRGGFPSKVSECEPYYVYGRKHGDMERDYNNFQIPDTYYSSGPGNFRDVCQNRRNDLIFSSFISDYNIKTFFSLIQVDGQNPLSVKPASFTLNEVPNSFDILDKDRLEKVKKIKDKYYPSDLISILKDDAQLSDEDTDRQMLDAMKNSTQNIEACFAEGYWVDHWTYLVDLLENFSSVYPDKEKDLFFKDKSYRYFHSPVYVKPRDEKTVLLPNGEVRQYGAIDLEALKKKCDRNHIDINKTDWLKDENGNVIESDLASKIINLILIKFSLLDSEQIGLEMECEKPGWNDAMNGLPGLFASGMCETIELLRLVRYAIKHLAVFSSENVFFLEKQYELFEGEGKYLDEFNNGKIDSFTYWDKVTSLREALRFEYQDNADNSKTPVLLDIVLPLLKKMEALLVKAIDKAMKLGNGILPTYLIYEVEEYENLNKTSTLGYPLVKVKKFRLKTLPPFLEASARALKIENTPVDKDSIRKIKDSDLYDKKLHVYKTCADIEDAPFEIGRIHAFTKGWLERECCFLHMDYKYLLGLLKAGYYDEFYHEIMTNWTMNLDEEVYGRNPSEASSFIVPTCNPDESKHGLGVEARLTGANTEMLNMALIMFLGDGPFVYEDNRLQFKVNPKLSKEFFDENGKCDFLLFSRTWIHYENPKHIDAYKATKITYVLNGEEYDSLDEKTSLEIREGKIKDITVRIK